MEHKTLCAAIHSVLDEKINTHLADDWDLYRGIVIYRGRYIQAMTRTVKQKKEPVKRFQKPTKKELLAHKADKGLNFDVNAFHDFYESCGWTVGRKPMKSWTHAVSNWIRNNKNFTPTSKADSRVKHKAT